MQYRILGKTGLSASVIGFGASPLGNEFGYSEPAEGKRAVHCAIDRGINFFDVSPYYGRTLAETCLGEALNGKRQKVILATKCGRYDVDGFDFSAERVKASVDESLQRLRTDYIDVLQAHDIEFGCERQILEETIPALRQVQTEGKARFVGITGYPLKLLARVACAGNVDTVLSYCRYNLLIRDMDALLTPALQEKKTGLINAAPLHMGVLTERGAPAWHPATKQVLETGQKIARLCRSYQVGITQLALRFCIEHPYVATTLVGMSSSEEVEENLCALDFKLPAGLLAEVDRIVEPVKHMVWAPGKPEYAS